MKNIYTDVLIIGAGASGITAAISASHSLKHRGKNGNITLIEKSERIGKKILMTGNGKCNLSNERISKSNYNDAACVIEPLLLKYSSDFVRDFFDKIGLLTKVDNEGRIYPYTDQASSVLNVLRAELDRCGVQIFSNVDVTSIDNKNNKFIVAAGNLRFVADKVIVSVGGLASPGKVFADSIYPLVRKLGHTFKEPFPALVPVKTSSGMEKSLKGIRWDSQIALFDGNKKVQEEAGEVQFTDYGLSGICVFQISRTVGELMRANKSNQLKLAVDLMPDYDKLEILNMLKKRAKNKIEIGSVFVGILNNRLGQAVLKQCKCLSGPDKLANLTDAPLRKIVETVKKLEFRVDGLQSFKQAQVMSGGFSLEEINLNTMESLRTKGLYLTGEMLNVDGICGGFNLHWAWVSGFIAGRSATE